MSRRLNRAAWTLVKCVGAMGLVLGGLDAALAGALPVLLPGLFTKSAAVAQHMATGGPTLALCLLLHALSNMLEGVLFATGDLKFFSRQYPASSIAVFFLFAKQRAAGGLFDQAGTAVRLSQLQAEHEAEAAGRGVRLQTREARVEPEALLAACKQKPPVRAEQRVDGAS